MLDVTLDKFIYCERQTNPNRQLKCSGTLSILQYQPLEYLRSLSGSYTYIIRLFVLILTMSLSMVCFKCLCNQLYFTFIL